MRLAIRPLMVAVAILGAVAIAACSSSSGGDPVPDGTGGTAGGGGSGKGSSSSGVEPAACTQPTSTADCASCSAQASCLQCIKAYEPSSYQLYDAVVQCTDCDACYMVCSGAANGCGQAPGAQDICDTGSTGNSSDCIACRQCAINGKCASLAAACAADAGCNDIRMRLTDICPQIN